MEAITVDSGKGTAELGADGIIHLIWNARVNIEAVDAHAAMAAVVVGNGSEYPMLVDMTTMP